MVDAMGIVRLLDSQQPFSTCFALSIRVNSRFKIRLGRSLALPNSSYSLMAPTDSRVIYSIRGEVRAGWLPAGYLL
jgi:hypothetical protein